MIYSGPILRTSKIFWFSVKYSASYNFYTYSSELDWDLCDFLELIDLNIFLTSSY